MKMKMHSSQSRKIGYALALIGANVVRVTGNTVTVSESEKTKVNALVNVGFVPTHETAAFGKPPIADKLGFNLALESLKLAYNGIQDQKAGL